METFLVIGKKRLHISIIISYFSCLLGSAFSATLTMIRLIGNLRKRKMFYYRNDNSKNRHVLSTFTCLAAIQIWENVHHVLMHRHPDTLKQDEPCDQQEVSKPFCLKQPVIPYYILQKKRGTDTFPQIPMPFNICFKRINKITCCFPIFNICQRNTAKVQLLNLSTRGQKHTSAWVCPWTKI